MGGKIQARGQRRMLKFRIQETKCTKFNYLLLPRHELIWRSMPGAGVRLGFKRASGIKVAPDLASDSLPSANRHFLDDIQWHEWLTQRLRMGVRLPLAARSLGHANPWVLPHLRVLVQRQTQQHLSGWARFFTQASCYLRRFSVRILET